MPPLPAGEVMEVARWVWLNTESGGNWNGRRMLALDADEALRMIEADPDACLVLSFAKATNRPSRDFMLHNGLAEQVGMSRKRFAAARTRLEVAGEIIMVRPPADGTGPPLYRFRHRFSPAGKRERHRDIAFLEEGGRF